jgi:hypothetical protein
MVNVRRPRAVVVSAHASASERKPNFLSGDRGERVEEVAGRAGEPGHHQHIAGVELLEDAAKLGRPVLAPLATPRKTLAAPCFLSATT